MDVSWAKLAEESDSEESEEYVQPKYNTRKNRKRAPKFIRINEGKKFNKRVRVDIAICEWDNELQIGFTSCKDNSKRPINFKCTRFYDCYVESKNIGLIEKHFDAITYLECNDDELNTYDKLVAVYFHQHRILTYYMGLSYSIINNYKIIKDAILEERKFVDNDYYSFGISGFKRHLAKLTNHKKALLDLFDLEIQTLYGSSETQKS